MLRWSRDPISSLSLLLYWSAAEETWLWESDCFEFWHSIRILFYRTLTVYCHMLVHHLPYWVCAGHPRSQGTVLSKQFCVTMPLSELNRKWGLHKEVERGDKLSGVNFNVSKVETNKTKQIQSKQPTQRFCRLNQMLLSFHSGRDQQINKTLITVANTISPWLLLAIEVLEQRYYSAQFFVA